MLILGDRPFIPIDPDRVTLYVCGPTVYDEPHIGNLRSAVMFDVLFRVLRRLYGEQAVVFARNYTDIDDKIIARMVAENRSLEDVTETAIRQYEEATAALHVLPPTLTPKVTASLDAIIGFIDRLIEKGAAYEWEGHVLFDRQKNPEFFLNTNLDPNELARGAGADGSFEYKRHPHDFVLWKPVTPDKPVGWPSPWGEGRPGWHIECSAMIDEYLGPGNTIDIHGGGNDLKFPHHENECAQSHALHGQPLARYWVHNGMLVRKYDGPKMIRGREDGIMSKSRGNIVTLSDLLKDFSAEAIRYFMLSAHYRQPLIYKESHSPLQQAEATVKTLKRAMRKVGPMLPKYGALGPLLRDLNTPATLARLNELGSRIHGNLASDDEIGEFISLADVLGLHEGYEEKTSDEIVLLRQARREARERRDFTEADRIRDVLIDMGAEVQDEAL